MIDEDELSNLCQDDEEEEEDYEIVLGEMINKM